MKVGEIGKVDRKIWSSPPPPHIVLKGHRRNESQITMYEFNEKYLKRTGRSVTIFLSGFLKSALGQMNWTVRRSWAKVKFRNNFLPWIYLGRKGGVIFWKRDVFDVTFQIFYSNERWLLIILLVYVTLTWICVLEKNF